MTEREWVDNKLKPLTETCIKNPSKYRVESHEKLPYGYEIVNYSTQDETKYNISQYETDILISEKVGRKKWKPRIIIEAKIERISTHGVLAYSKKAGTHKSVHPYLRYGVFLANRKDSPLPGRLFRHGDQFDFMISIRGFDPTKDEIKNYKELLQSEIQASQKLEHIIYDSRKQSRDKYTILQRKLCLTR